MERDEKFPTINTIFDNFNSHAHVERDYQEDIFPYYNNDFNSHAHVERDVWDFEGVYTKFISTHTLTWSVT